jgi:hypothetical protein
MNGETVPNNSKVIHFVVLTVCAGALVCIGTEAYCYINKVPDMNTNLSGAFMHVTDTLIGALIAMLINTRPQQQQPQVPEKLPVEIKQPENNPVPVVETAPKIEGQP